MIYLIWNDAGSTICEYYPFWPSDDLMDYYPNLIFMIDDPIYTGEGVDEIA